MTLDMFLDKVYRGFNLRQPIRQEICSQNTKKKKDLFSDKQENRAFVLNQLRRQEICSIITRKKTKKTKGLFSDNKKIRDMASIYVCHKYVGNCRSVLMKKLFSNNMMT